jgi:FKBP-type peptidyl-prolyl cis-trans isomerase
MKKAIMAVIVAAQLAATMSCVAKPAKKTKIDTTNAMHRYSYMVGQDVGKSLKGLDTELDISLITQGIEDVLKGNASQMSDSTLQATQVEFSQKLQSDQTAKQSAKAEKNKADGEKFLADNKSKEGVKVTASGLQYVVLKEGDGAMPKATDEVTVHYVGTLLDGTEFDNSVKRGQPVTFPLNGVIPGWTEGVQLMKVGSKFKFFVPSALGYGSNGTPGGPIGPDATLIFEVELISINEAPAEAN